MGKTKSLREKLIETISLILLIFAIFMGLISAIHVTQLSKEDSRQMMKQICEMEVLRFDNKLNQIKHSVHVIANNMKQQMKLHGEEYIYTEECEETIQDLAISIANGTDGAVSVYFRYNPEVVNDGKKGFFWVYDSMLQQFTKKDTTDILEYSENDMAHVGWFYVPKKAGKALWMDPYYNKNLDIFMISYVIPIFRTNGEFVGVVGMDIDFNKMMQVLGKTKIYKTGKVCVVDLSERITYLSDKDKKTVITRLDTDLYNHISTMNKTDDLLEYTNNEGKPEVICCDKLSNGMRLYVTVPKDEINENRNTLMKQYLFFAVAILIFAFLFVNEQISKVMIPIRKLAEVTNRYAKGEWNHQYIIHSGDEIEELSKSIAQMAQTTQSYIQFIWSEARKDSLTGLNNKTYYMECVRKLKHPSDAVPVEYGIVVFDLNNLKTVNDTYGHEAGDSLILAGAKHIESSFQNSLVFRIGGDEFVALLKGEELNRRELLFRKFEDGLYKEIPEAHGTKLSIAYGFAMYGRDGMIYEEIFQHADIRMYEKKREMKRGAI